MRAVPDRQSPRPGRLRREWPVPDPVHGDGQGLHGEAWSCLRGVMVRRGAGREFGSGVRSDHQACAATIARDAEGYSRCRSADRWWVSGTPTAAIETVYCRLPASK